MENVLKAEKRDTFGTRPATKQRETGMIPGVLYGKGMDNVHFAVQERVLGDVLRSQERLIQIEIEGDKPVNALVHDLQYHPVSGDIIHLDAHMVRMDEKLELQIPIELFGAEIAPGVQEGGSLELHIHEVSVECLPTNIPDHISVDVSEMSIGDSLTVQDLPAMEGVTIMSDAEELLISLLEPIDVEADTDIEASLQELETAEPTVQKQKEDDEEEGSE